MEKMTLVIACKKNLSLPTETLVEFKKGFNLLTEKDREDLVKEFAKIGIEIVEKFDTAVQ